MCAREDAPAKARVPLAGRSNIMRGTIHTIRWGTVFTLVLTAAAAAMTQGIAASTARADNIDYGDSPEVPPGVRFLDVIESSGTDAVPLLGQPDYFTTGIDFDPLGFTATETGGASDITEAQLNFTIASAGKKKKTPTVGVEQISLFKAGDYTLSGSGTSATQALAGTILRATVTEIDGESVSPSTSFRSTHPLGSTCSPTQASSSRGRWACR
jgi:hypothetical protein